MIRGREYAVYRDGGGMIGIDATGVRLDALNLHRLERFIYEYDFGDDWIHDLRIEATWPVNPRKTYPACVAGKRAAPPEDCGGPAAFMANRGRSTEDLDVWMDELADNEPHDFSDYEPDRFDRKLINRGLAKLATGYYEEALDEFHNPSVDRNPRRTATHRANPEGLSARATGSRMWGCDWRRQN